ncbi:MAG: hypothetical protein HGB30_02145 [Holophagaceae bacterium]|nr:hypothetical protein [Holophagaceae bacterium]
MDALAISPLGTYGLKPPATVLATPKVQAYAQDSANTAVQRLAQELAQGLFRQSLQAVALAPVVEPAAASPSFDSTATASLLAALTAPQAPTGTTSAATSLSATQATAPSQPVTTASQTLPQDLSALQDTFQTGASVDFALQTALRFGAGVVTPAGQTSLPGELSAGLVRDAAAVPRLRNLQPNAGGPGPEAFAQTQAQLDRVLRTYTPPPVPEVATQLDLLA